MPTPPRLPKAACAAALLLAGCSPAPAADAPSAPPAAPTAPSTASAPASAATAPPTPADSAQAPASALALAPAAPSSGAPASGVAPWGLDDATLERRTFRQVLVGHLPRGRRVTWVLLQGERQARLRLLCQRAARGKREFGSLDGTENQESAWMVPTRVEYLGERTSERPLIYRLTRSFDEGDSKECPELPASLDLRCEPASVAARAAGAALLPGRKGDDDRMSPARWRPSTRETTQALRCAAADFKPEPNMPRSTDPWPLFFAPPTRKAPGIEWAYENSDMVVQEGDYRWMPPPP